MRPSDYNPFNTAIRRTSPSAPTRFLYERDLLEGPILDYGCGYGKDVEFLRGLGYTCEGYDRFNSTFDDIEVLVKHNYSTIICNYVFNVIYDWKTLESLKNTLPKLAKNVYVSVRSDVNSIKATWKYDFCHQGYWNKTNFQRFFTINDVKEEFVWVEIIFATKNYILFKFLK